MFDNPLAVQTALAAAHHLAAFAIPALIAAECAMLSLVVMDTHWLRRMAALDAVYGVTALALLAVGVLRVMVGGKGAEFYLNNHAFWAKMVAFAVVGLLSIAPTLTLIRWRKSQRLPTPAQLRALRRWLIAELLTFCAIPVFAAMMARGVGA